MNIDNEKNIAAKALLKNAKISPRKIKLVIDEIRGKKIDNAIRTLLYSKKKAAGMLLKLLNSAVSNSINNNNYSKDNLYISQIWVGKGMMLKRTEPRARGSGNRFLRRYSNVWIYLGEVK